MARIYIKEGLITYAVETRMLETNSNYDMAISFRMVGERFPACGMIIKSTENVRKFAKETIKRWANKTPLAL
jgi:hypothetical protein